MAGKISELVAFTAAATSDLIEAVDVSDTSMAATGTNKKMTLADLGTTVVLPKFWDSQAPPVGQYINMAYQGATNTGTLGTTTANARCGQFTPIPVPVTMSFDMVSQYVSTPATDAGSVFRLALYTADASYGGPADLVQEFGTIDATTAAGLRTIVISPALTLPPGLYWMALQFQSATTAGTNPQIYRNSCPLNAYSAQSNTWSGYNYQGSVTAQNPMPSDIRAYALANAANQAALPRCLLRRSA